MNRVEKPRWVAGEVRVANPEELDSLLARDGGGPYLPMGTGTHLARGAPPSHPVTLLDLTSLDRVLEHAHEDLTVTVETGLRLSQLAERLRAQNQWLPPAIPAMGTVGGLIGSDRRSPWSGGLGSVRDYLLGVTVLNGRGSRIRAGGRVVKNVAGFDFMKLVTGSLGELGAVVEATFRLLPIPAGWAGVVLPHPDTAVCEETLLLGPGWFPAGLWRCHRENEEQLVAVFAGNTDRVEEQVRRARKLWGEDSTPVDENTVQRWVSEWGSRARGRMGWGGALPSFLATGRLAEMLRGADWVADLLAGHFWWFPKVPVDLERVLRIREFFREGLGHLNLDGVGGGAEPWGFDPGPEAELWHRIRTAFDPDGRWVGGRLPGGV